MDLIAANFYKPSTLYIIRPEMNLKVPGTAT